MYTIVTLRILFLEQVNEFQEFLYSVVHDYEEFCLNHENLWSALRRKGVLDNINIEAQYEAFRSFHTRAWWVRLIVFQTVGSSGNLLLWSKQMTSIWLMILLYKRCSDMQSKLNNLAERSSTAGLTITFELKMVHGTLLLYYDDVKVFPGHLQYFKLFLSSYLKDQ